MSDAGGGAPAPRRKRRGRLAKVVVAGGIVTLALSQDARNRLLDLLFGPEEEFEYESETEPVSFGLGPRDPQPAPAESEPLHDEDADERADREWVAELEELESAITGEGPATKPTRLDDATPLPQEAAAPDAPAPPRDAPSFDDGEPRTFAPLRPRPPYEPPSTPSTRRFEPAPAADPQPGQAPLEPPGLRSESPASGEAAFQSATARRWGGVETAAAPPPETHEPAVGRFEWQAPSAEPEPLAVAQPPADESPALEHRETEPDAAAAPQPHPPSTNGSLGAFATRAAVEVEAESHSPVAEPESPTEPEPRHGIAGASEPAAPPPYERDVATLTPPVVAWAAGSRAAAPAEPASEPLLASETEPEAAVALTEPLPEAHTPTEVDSEGPAETESQAAVASTELDPEAHAPTEVDSEAPAETESAAAQSEPPPPAGPEAGQAPTASAPESPAEPAPAQPEAEAAAPRRGGWWLPRRRSRAGGSAEPPRWD